VQEPAGERRGGGEDKHGARSRRRIRDKSHGVHAGDRQGQGQNRTRWNSQGAIAGGQFAQGDMHGGGSVAAMLLRIVGATVLAHLG